MSDPLWFKDAVIYELHIKAFQDSNDDGVGDFRGLLQRLDYFAELGVTAIWLLPFYPSPLRDDGYDIADYYAVHPSYGTIEDFRMFLDEAHARGLRVITELVLNHTSDQNPWFQRARRAAAGSPERDFYVWSDDPRGYADARIIFKDFETSNWTWDPMAKAYFWHRFYSHQPDLNFDNPIVHAELFKVIDFWFEMGVDGMRLDAVPYLYEREGTNCENLPETHEFLCKLRAHIDARFSDRMLLAEANQWPEDAAAYFGKGDECHMEFHFPLMPRMFMALQMEDRFPIIDILDQTPTIPPNCQWAIFLRNHDELTLEMVTDEERDYMYRVYAQDPRARINLGIRRRLAPLLGNNRRKVELINSLLLSLPGTPILYYGDEIGMGDNFYLGDRNGVRTPMQWSPDRNAGFSKANPQQLYLPTIIDPEYHYESVNVENQQKNVSSLYWWMRRILAIRQRWVAFARGTIEFIQPDNAKVLAFLRKIDGETVLVVANLSRFSQVAELDLAEFAGLVPEELFGRVQFPEIKQAPTVLTLGPHGFYWFALQRVTAEQGSEAGWQAPALVCVGEWSPEVIRRLERTVLPAYIPTCRWFGGKGRVIRETRVVHRLGHDGSTARVAVVEVGYSDGSPDTYLVPLAFVDGNRAEQLRGNSPHAVLARFDGERILCDAFQLPEFRAELLRLMVRGDGDLSAKTRMAASGSATISEEEFEKGVATSRLVHGDQSNTSILYDGVGFLKFFRKFERGPHPDVEVTRFLTESRGFPNGPIYKKSLRLIDSEGEGVAAVLVSSIQHQGDGWTYTIDALTRFFERVLETRIEPSDETAMELVGAVYPERARQLGLRTAELHRALDRVDRPDFVSEPFSTLYQRSLYQAMRGSAGRVLRLLRRQLPSLNGGVFDDANEVLSNQAQILSSFRSLLSRKIEAQKIRIHGDFHLGQVLNTGKDFVIIDFEGEPRLALGERTLKRSPLRDVAGMLRSFDYAAAAALGRQNDGDVARLEGWARTWVHEISRSYLGSYLEGASGAAFLPSRAEDAKVLLEAFLLDKAVYEIGYELSYRPEYLAIPLRAVLRLLNDPTAGLGQLGTTDVFQPAELAQ